MSATRRCLIAVFPGFQSLDAVGPLEVLTTASRLAAARGGRHRPYEVALAAAEAPVTSSSGLAVVPHRGFGAVRSAIDTLIVAGGQGTRAAAADPELIGFVRRAAGRARRVASVCTGAFVLAAAGLLDGKRATTHWAWCDTLARQFPAVEVAPDPIFVRDGKVITSAGVTAGMDLALDLVDRDFGRRLALETARWLVMFVRRPGGQSQFSAQLGAQLAERPAIRAIQDLILDQVDGDLTVDALAERAGMSPRNFARVFRSEVGVTPAAYVERARVEVARRLLEETRLGLDEIAETAGFGSIETLRRAFARRLEVSPRAYRSRFRAA